MSSISQPPRHPELAWPSLYAAVALTTLATLVLELALTRIFSVVFYYHFAFLAISIALFGMGAGGVFSYVVSGWKGKLFHKLGLLSIANSLLVILALTVVLVQKEELGNWRLALVYFATALPFFVSGTILSLAIAETVERVDRVYFFDLIGAAGGCLLLVPLLNHLGGPNAVIAVAATFAAAAGIWLSMGGTAAGRVVTVGLALLLVVLIGINSRYNILNVRYAKGKKLEGETFVKWNSFSRISIAPEKQSRIPLIFIDADASTGIANFDFEKLTERDLRDLLYQGPGLPYVIRPAAKTLIIGAGGGWDAARALASGSKDVTGVEINPIIANTIMREKFPDMSRRLYFRPDVRIVVEDGRSFVRRSREKYQVLQATLVDTWASTAAGAFALSENNLYTTDAFHDYLSHLTDDGLLAFTRWGFEPPRESLRLISLAIPALRRLGESEPWRHVIVAREGTREELAGWGNRDTVIISRKPLVRADVERAATGMAKGGMEAVYVPGEAADSPFRDLLHSPDPAAYQRDYPFDISPVNDNRPFFFYSVQPRDVWAFLTRASTKSADYKINRAVPLLFELLAVSLLATVLTLALPPLLLRARLPREPGIQAFLLYFAAIGAGYILIEVALIQKFVLFLGHPTYALTVVIFSMLVSSGLGSFFSRRMLGRIESRLRAAVLAVAVLVLALAIILGGVLTAGVGWPFSWKVAVSVLLIFPPGFVMGMPFPSGLRRLEGLHPPSVRWAWSLNAASSVLGSVGAIFCAIYLGLMQTLLVGGALYLAALLILTATRKKAGSSLPVYTG
ncbi:MAG: hypothetical protein IT158_14925 [Bryobacterales bacterium]|nr:hypothetical protein [Bryobacterales bacterium]